MIRKAKKPAPIPEVLSQEIKTNALRPLELVAKAPGISVEKIPVEGGHLYITTYCIGKKDGFFQLSVASSFVPS